jgi:hypothetical protein
MNQQYLKALAAALVLTILMAVPSSPAAATDVPFTSFQGEWTAVTTYSAGEVVTYQQALYIGLADSNSHHPPALSPHFWTVLVPGNTTFGSNSFTYTQDTSNDGESCTLSSITLYSAQRYPDNLLPADGRLLSVSAYSALFTLLGTHYGGDGISTFAVPDLRAAAPNNTAYLICVLGVFP